MELISDLMIALLRFGRWDASGVLQRPSMVDPVDTFQRREPDGLERLPWFLAVDSLSLIGTIDGLGEGVDAAMPVKRL